MKICESRKCQLSGINWGIVIRNNGWKWETWPWCWICLVLCL